MGVVPEVGRAEAQGARDAPSVGVLDDYVAVRLPRVLPALLGYLGDGFTVYTLHLTPCNSEVLGPTGVGVGVIGHPDEPLARLYGVVDLLPEVRDLQPLAEGLAAAQLPEPGLQEAAEVGHDAESAADEERYGVPRDVEFALAIPGDHVYGRLEVGLLQLRGRRGVYLPAGAEVGEVQPHAGPLIDVHTLHEGRDLLVGDVPRRHAAPPPSPPPVGAVDAAVLLDLRYGLHYLLLVGVDVGVIVEAGAHADAPLLHALVDERVHLLPLLLGAVTLVVEAHDLGAYGAVSEQRNIVDADARLLHLLEEAPHGLPVQGPPVYLLHPPVDLLQLVPRRPGIVLVWLKVHQMILEKPRHLYVRAEGRWASAALAANEGGDALHDVALRLGEPE